MLQAAIPYGATAARLCLAVVFLYSGVDKLRHWRDGVEEVARMGLPQPSLFAALTILVQLAGGAMVASGWNAPAGALLLAGFTVAATLAGHRFWALRGSEARRELTTALEHLAIVGGLALVALRLLSLDN
jgi:uncharacterized membrane protein YphA (DoxX/SURF4 family)